MTDFSLGYESDGEHHGLGVGLSKPPDSLTVREHLEDGTYIETPYVPKRTCKPIEDEYGDMKCSECGKWLCTDFDLVSKDVTAAPYCPNCGAEVQDGD